MTDDDASDDATETAEEESTEEHASYADRVASQDAKLLLVLMVVTGILISAFMATCAYTFRLSADAQLACMQAGGDWHAVNVSSGECHFSRAAPEHS